MDEQVPAGTHKADWDARGLPSGTYFYRFTVDGKPLSWPDARRLLEAWSSRHVPVLTVRRGGAARLTVLPEDPEE